MVQEDAESRAVHLCVSTTKLSAHILMEALRHHEEQHQVKTHSAAQGKVKVKDLIADGSEVQTMPVTGKEMKGFQRIANKYGLSFSIVKDKSAHTPRYLVFFRAKDADVISQVVKEYTAKQLMKKRKPSIMKQLENVKDAAQEIGRKVIQKKRERER